MYTGRRLKIYFDDVLVAACRTKSLSFSRQSIDETDGEDNGWRRVNETPELRSVTVPVQGIATAANFRLLDEFFQSGSELPSFRGVLPNGGEIVPSDGAFLSQLDYTGEVAGGVVFSATLLLAGSISRVPPPIEPANLFIYLEDDTYALNESALLIEVWAIGGGGGGGGGGSRGSGASGGGGGGGGGYSYEAFVPGDLGAMETVTVGDGGAAGEGSADSQPQGFFGGSGDDGGDSSFGAHVTAGGGDGGGGGAVSGGGTLNISTGGGPGGAGTVAAGGDGGDGSETGVLNGGDTQPGDDSIAGGGGGGGGQNRSGNSTAGQAGGDGDDEFPPYSKAGGQMNGEAGESEAVFWFAGGGGAGSNFVETPGSPIHGGGGGLYGGGGAGGGAGDGDEVDNDGGTGAQGVVVVAEWDENLPVPTVTAISSPDSIEAGAGDTEITIRGRGFVKYRKSIVYWGAVELGTLFDNTVQVRATVLAADLAIPGTYPVTVVTSGPGGGTSNAVGLQVTGTFPVPTLTSIDPTSVVFSFLTEPLVMTLTGTHFSPDAEVHYDGAALPSSMVEWVSDTEILVTFPTDYWSSGETVNITVVNPTPGGGESGAQSFTAEAWDGFPVVKFVDIGDFSSASTDDIPIPEGEFAAGDLVLMIPARRALATQQDFVPDGWAFLLQSGFTPTPNNLVNFVVYGRVMDGDETGSITIEGNDKLSFVRMVIQVDTFDPVLFDIANATGDADGGVPQPDPPSLSPEWGIDKTLWLVILNIATSTSGAGATDFPLPESNLFEQNTGIGADFPLAMGFCSDKLEQATLDPPAWVIDSLGNRQWTTSTIGIKPPYAEAGDQFWDDVALLVGYEGADGSTSFSDLSDAAHPLTAQGNAQIDTDVLGPFGDPCGFFDGSDSYVTAPDDPDWTLGSADLTLETFIRFAGGVGVVSQGIMTHYNASSNQRAWRFYLRADGDLVFYWNTNGGTGSAHNEVSMPWNPSLSQWHHLMVGRKDNHLVFGLNGQVTFLVDAIGNDSIFNSTADLQLGAFVDGFTQHYLNGWLAESRITLNRCRYLMNYTVPTAKFPRS